LFPVRAERATIGQVLMRGAESMSRLRTIVTALDYSDKRSHAAYVALCDLDDAGQLPPNESVGLFKLWDQLAANGETKHWKDMAELATFKHDAPGWGEDASAGDPAELVSRGAMLRQAIAECSSGIEALSTRTELVEDMSGRTYVEGISERIAKLAQGGVNTTPLRSADEVTDEHEQRMRDRLEGRGGFVRTGLRCIDERTGGFSADDGELIIIAARPSMGKTAVAGALVRSQNVFVKSPTAPMRLVPGAWSTLFADRRDAERVPVLFASLEMSRVQLMDRMLADLCTIDSQQIARPTTSTWAVNGSLIEAARKQIKSWRLDYVDSPHMLEEIERAAKQWRLGHAIVGTDTRGQPKREPAILIIDHLGLLNMMSRPKGMSDAKYYGTMTRRLKKLAQRLGIAVVLLVQLNREVTKRQDPRPMLSDLRDSGEIEENADTVIMLHRPIYYTNEEDTVWKEFWKIQNMAGQRSADQWKALQDLEAKATRLDLYFPKVRQGSTGMGTIRFYRYYTRVWERMKQS
jgi:replicative DNA helicase